MRFIVLGTSQFVLTCTQALLDNGVVICAMISMPVDTRPNNSVNIKNFTDLNDIPYHEITDLSMDSSLHILTRYSADYFFISWPKILSDKVLNVPKKYCIGTHPTNLPYNRGRHPLHWLIALGISNTKVSFFHMDEGVDTGNILLQVTVQIAPKDTIGQLIENVNSAGYVGIEKLYQMLLCNPNYRGEVQNHNDANYWRKRTPHDITLDLRMSSQSILRTVNSFTIPYSCSNLIIENEILKIKCASISFIKMTPAQIKRMEPGKIISIKKNIICVKAEDTVIDLQCVKKIPINLLECKYIHPPSKYLMMQANEFVIES